MRRRARLSAEPLHILLDAMAQDQIAPREHVAQLAQELAAHHGVPALAGAASMGELLRAHLDHCFAELGDAVR